MAWARLRGRGGTAAAPPTGAARLSVPAMRGGRDAEIQANAETLRAMQKSVLAGSARGVEKRETAPW